MAKKEKVSLQRGDDFDEVDAQLADAMQALDETNARIVDLLESETRGEGPEGANTTAYAEEMSPEEEEAETAAEEVAANKEA